MFWLSVFTWVYAGALAVVFYGCIAGSSTETDNGIASGSSTETGNAFNVVPVSSLLADGGVISSGTTRGSFEASSVTFDSVPVFIVGVSGHSQVKEVFLAYIPDTQKQGLENKIPVYGQDTILHAAFYYMDNGSFSFITDSVGLPVASVSVTMRSSGVIPFLDSTTTAHSKGTTDSNGVIVLPMPGQAGGYILQGDNSQVVQPLFFSLINVSLADNGIFQHIIIPGSAPLSGTITRRSGLQVDSTMLFIQGTSLYTYADSVGNFDFGVIPRYYPQVGFVFNNSANRSTLAIPVDVTAGIRSVDSTSSDYVQSMVKDISCYTKVYSGNTPEYDFTRDTTQNNLWVIMDLDSCSIP